MDLKDQINKYNLHKSPPDSAKKTITGGRLKGMTDIKPQWRIQALTETYGLCGVGWYYEVINKEIIAGGENEQIGIADIKLYIKIDNEWSMGIAGSGGSSFVTQEKYGIHTSDEVFKMAITDALSVACKQIGIGSDVYLGYSDSKYQKPEEGVNEKPWLNKYTNNSKTQLTDLYKKVIAKIDAKEANVIENLQKHYKLNKDLKAELEGLINLK